MEKILAIAQIDSVLGDINKNISKHISFIKSAIKQNADLIVFPELSLTGYSLKDIVHDIALNENEINNLNEFKKLSRQISILVGLVEESNEFKYYNSFYLFEKGKVNLIHRKIYLPTYGMFEEGRYFSAGKDLKPFKTKSCDKIGVLICEDSWHPVLSNLLAHQGSKIIFSPTASPIRVSSNQTIENIDKTNQEIQKSIARLNSLFAVFVNRVGVEDGVQFYGASQIISPFGEVIAKAKTFDEDLLVTKIDLNLVKQSRILSRHFVDDSILITKKIINDILNKKGV